MCLEYSKFATDKLLKSCKKSKKTYIICYKVLHKCPTGRIISPVYKPYTWKGGWNYGKYGNYVKIKKPYKVFYKVSRTNYIDAGIHVYTTKAEAKNSWWYYGENDTIIIPVKCYLKDIIGCSENKEAVFAKVWVNKSDI